MRKVSAAIGVVLAFALGDARAQNMEAAQACTRVGDDAARLACYDTALGKAKAQGIPISSAQKSDAQAQFGDNGQLHRDNNSKTDLPKTLTGQLKQVDALAHGLYWLTLDNGQIWQTTEADMAMEFKAGDSVTISRRVLGGYLISLAAHARSVGAKRIK